AMHAWREQRDRSLKPLQEWCEIPAIAITVACRLGRQRRVYEVDGARYHRSRARIQPLLPERDGIVPRLAPRNFAQPVSGLDQLRQLLIGRKAADALVVPPVAADAHSCLTQLRNIFGSDRTRMVADLRSFGVEQQFDIVEQAMRGIFSTHHKLRPCREPKHAQFLP